MPPYFDGAASLPTFCSPLFFATRTLTDMHETPIAKYKDIHEVTVDPHTGRVPVLHSNQGMQLKSILDRCSVSEKDTRGTKDNSLLCSTRCTKGVQRPCTGQRDYRTGGKMGSAV